MRRALPLAALGGLLACGGSAREGPWAPAPASADDAVVAEVAGVPVYASQLRDQIRFLRARAAPGEGPVSARRALDDLVAFELLAQAARRAGLRPDGDADERKAALVARLVERDIEPHLRRADMPEVEARTVYRQNIRRFVRPRLVELQALSLYTGPRMNAGARREIEGKARALAQELAAHPPATAEAFAALAADPRFASPHTGYQAKVLQGGGEPFGREVGKAFEALRRPGELSRLIQTEDGFFVARCAGEYAPVDVPFAQARREIEDALFPRWREREFTRLTAALVERHDVHLEVDKLTVRHDGLDPTRR